MTSNSTCLKHTECMKASASGPSWRRFGEDSAIVDEGDEGGDGVEGI